ncbi:MAG: YihY/virulence factor BrkB family protein [Geodermatophilaceae bacterium]|nr:YihY/virulence factor BrkB family protein [Geodermatophilaceae bacterium]MDQ3463961.1 YihY/virulence factor BrkB family protein [Actinomycetota bacterium]
MSSANRVPETRDLQGDELSADDAWAALRHHGHWHLAKDAFVRFRYADGFSHSRALAMQLCLAVVPFLIALTGLAADLGQDKGGEVLGLTVLALSPGASDQLVRDTLSGGEAAEEAEEAGEVALTFGLVAGLLALTTAMAQIERGANRMYGVERDRPTLQKYLNALGLAVTAGFTAFAGFLVLVAGGPLGEAVEQVYDWGDTAETVWDVVRWPLGLGLTVLSVTILFEKAPRRRMPSLSWLVFGAGLATALWLLASVALALYIRVNDSFGDTYGPLTAVIALLVWANITAVALLLGLAFAAQLEAMRAGVPEPVEPDAGTR